MSLSLISEFDDLQDANLAAAAAEDDGEAVSESALTLTERSDDTRADVPISETSERFLRALLAKVPIDRIEELYLFAPLRQGAVETGIAVIAARNEVASAAPDFVGEAPAVAIDDAVAAEQITHNNVLTVEVDDAPESNAASLIGQESTKTSAEAQTSIVETDSDSPYAEDVPEQNAEPDLNIANNASSDGAESFALSDDAFTRTDEPFDLHLPVRHTVLTARYRLVIKGPDRGRWEIDVVDEGDAPLLTVETVVRGVQRRAGEETATVRYSAQQLARTLRLPATGTL